MLAGCDLAQALKFGLVFIGYLSKGLYYNMDAYIFLLA